MTEIKLTEKEKEILKQASSILENFGDYLMKTDYEAIYPRCARDFYSQWGFNELWQFLNDLATNNYVIRYALPDDDYFYKLWNWEEEEF